MSFAVLAVRSQRELPTVLYPTPAALADTVVLESGETLDLVAHAVAVTVTAVASGQRPVRRSGFADVLLTVRVTDRRVVIACSDWERGGRWGAETVSPPLPSRVNGTGSDAASARTMLVGHVRYGWLQRVSTGKRGLLTLDTVELRLADPEHGHDALLVELTMDGVTRAERVAGCIAAHVERVGSAGAADRDGAGAT